MFSFASDNNSGAHAEVMAALAAANSGHCLSYGGDPFTRRAEELFQDVFGAKTRVYFVFLGTAANVLALQTGLKAYEAVICADTAHIHTDECGALEALGRKLYTVPGRHGKIAPADCLPPLRFAGSVHHAPPRMLSITQSTELGGLYRPAEIRALADFCRAHGLWLHMDGARLANAAAALGCGLHAASAALGVDMLSFGGSKNGLLYGEAVLIFRPELAEDFAFYHKRGMQLASKMRYIAAQFQAYLHNDLWRRNAQQANDMARLLAESLEGTEGLEITRPVEVNAVFARLPRRAALEAQKSCPFYIWDETPEETPEARWMTSFDTTPEAVRDFAAKIKNALRGK
ncbi:MAG: threonine aldolase [Deltaproteobacteria bacterium]|jgi:threonine aldolase|nr:threonine aldolase [Deltaproteobacteria bacterium]